MKSGTKPRCREILLFDLQGLPCQTEIQGAAPRSRQGWNSQEKQPSTPLKIANRRVEIKRFGDRGLRHFSYRDRRGLTPGSELPGSPVCPSAEADGGPILVVTSTQTPVSPASADEQTKRQSSLCRRGVSPSRTTLEFCQRTIVPWFAGILG